ncbi:hypothetical protein CGRA01v4_05395 [Colletotrichum graminicola]|nr:hypothetical protein CGRA01v4_05395 [Colletotrichum graminicola]
MSFSPSCPSLPLREYPTVVNMVDLTPLPRDSTAFAKLFRMHVPIPWSVFVARAPSNGGNGRQDAGSIRQRRPSRDKSQPQSGPSREYPRAYLAFFSHISLFS